MGRRRLHSISDCLLPTRQEALGAGWEIPRIWIAEDGDEFGFDALGNHRVDDGAAWLFTFWGDWTGSVQTIPLYVTCADV